MKFEEILPLMREGKRAQTDSDALDNRYWMLHGLNLTQYRKHGERIDYNLRSDPLIGSDTWKIVNW